MNHELIAEYLKQIDLAENEHSPWRRRDYADGFVDILRDIFTDDELIELAQAKAEGRLIVLPCKVGDTVYRLDGVYSWDIEHIEIYGDEIIFVDDSDNIFRLDDIGKTVFLTREEAERDYEYEDYGFGHDFSYPIIYGADWRDRNETRENKIK